MWIQGNISYGFTSFSRCKSRIRTTFQNKDVKQETSFPQTITIRSYNLSSGCIVLVKQRSFSRHQSVVHRLVHCVYCIFNQCSVSMVFNKVILNVLLMTTEN